MIPKAEIHVHIEGTAHPELVRKYAQKNSVDLTGLFASDGAYVWSDFTSFIAAYDRASSVFCSEEAYCDLAYDYAKRCAAEGAIYLEVFASPDHAAEAGLSYRAYIDGLDAGFAAAETAYGIVARIIVVGVRHLGPETVAEAARQAVAQPHPRVTGFGMAGDERFGEVADYARAFAIAGDAGLGLTVHAGELAGPESVRAALDHLPVNRIGHGVRAIEDADLVRRLADEAITLELCPGSNIALGLYPDRQSHPLKHLLQAGIRVTLNSDDPPFFHTTIGAEYAAAARLDGIDEQMVRQFTRNALDAAFIDAPLRSILIGRLDYAAKDIPPKQTL